MHEATLTSKSQLTLPKTVRDAMGVETGDRIRFVPTRNGFRIVSMKGDIRKLRGLFKGRNASPVSIDDMNKAIAQNGRTAQPKQSMIGLDTNILVRYVTQDDAAQSRLVNRVLDSRVTAQAPGFVSVVTVIELVWVLQAHYAASRDDVSVATEELLCDPRFRVQHEGAVWRAVDEFSLTQTSDFADALIAALGQENGCDTTLTFDKKAARLEGTELLK